MRVVALLPDGFKAYDIQHGYPGDEGPVTDDEKKVVIAEAARRLRILLRADTSHQIEAKVHVGAVRNPSLTVHFGPMTAENCANMKSEESMTAVWAAHCAAESSKYRLWLRDEVFQEFDTVNEATEYRDGSTLALRLTPPTGSELHYTIALTRAVLENM
jgi:hypothetical protein